MNKILLCAAAFAAAPVARALYYNELYESMAYR